MQETRSIAFHTLGCKLNFSETSSMRRDFENEGFELGEFDEKADIYVINTCSVTMDANSACRKTVRQALRRNPDAFVAVVGCYAQLEPEEIAEIEGVDVVLGAKDKFNLLDLFDNFVKQEKMFVQCQILCEVSIHRDRPPYNTVLTTKCKAPGLQWHSQYNLNSM